MPKDPYDFPSGLVDDFDLEVTNAYFNFNTKITPAGADPRVALHLEGKAEGGTLDSPTELEGETALLFSVGDRWLVTDGGAKVVDQDGRDRTFGGGTTIASFVRSAVDAGVPLRELGPPQEAGIWKGLRLHLKRVTMPGFGENPKPRQVLQVERYLGKAEDATSGATAPAAASTPAASGDDLGLIQSAVGGPIFKRLQKLAAESADYDTFASEAVELPKVKDDDGLQDILLDEARGSAVYEKLKG